MTISRRHILSGAGLSATFCASPETAAPTVAPRPSLDDLVFQAVEHMSWTLTQPTNLCNGHHFLKLKSRMRRQLRAYADYYGARFGKAPTAAHLLVAITTFENDWELRRQISLGHDVVNDDAFMKLFPRIERRLASAPWLAKLNG